MSPAPAASLHTGLLASKGTAQPSRRAAQPLAERTAGNEAPDGARLRTVAEGAPSRARTPTHGRIALRLDERQRLRLRLASAHLGKSRQEILMDALEHYLTAVVPTFLHGPCSCIGAAYNEADPCCRDKP